MKHKLTLLSVFCWMASLGLLSHATDRNVTHVVTEGETAWFLASVYFGKGSDYTKILSANKLQRPEDLKEGMEIRLENPKYMKTSQGFSERYAGLWEKRQKALGLSTGGGLPYSKVTLPTEKILRKDKTPHLLFPESTKTVQSAAELAQEELLKKSRGAEKGE